MTISQWLQQAQMVLTDISDAPRLDAERIALHVLGQPEASWLYAHGKEMLNAKQQAEFERLLAERAIGKPLAYALGEWEFYGRMFYITEDVLVPRPETENLVAEALKYIRPGMTVADIGTGSGVIAVTLALETPSPRSARALPLRKGEKVANVDAFGKRLSSPYEGEGGRTKRDGGVHFLATDISPAALAVAQKNAKRYGVGSEIEFLHGDMLAPLRDKKIDLIVSNPPYIPTAELDPLPHPVWKRGLQFEPQMALDGGVDGQKYLQLIQNSGLPAIVEGLNGEIRKFNI